MVIIFVTEIIYPLTIPPHPLCTPPYTLTLTLTLTLTHTAGNYNLDATAMSVLTMVGGGGSSTSDTGDGQTNIVTVRPDVMEGHQHPILNLKWQEETQVWNLLFNLNYSGWWECRSMGFRWL